jgi:hypothetical protein
MMQIRGWLVTSGVAFVIATAFVGQPEPARAQFGISIGGFPIGINLHGGFRYRGGRRHRAPRGRGEEASQSEQARPGKPEKVVASEGAPSSTEQMDVLKRIASSAVVTDVGSTKDLNEVGQQSVALKDRNRDYTIRIGEIIEKFKEAERKGRAEARKEARGETREMTSGDVTAHAIEQSLDRAVKNSKLDVFERFVNEAWTPERLRVAILDRVQPELSLLFEGNNRGKAPMEALDSLIQRAGEAVYRRIFETSELLAANRSSAQFMQRIYLAHGASVNTELRESTDNMLYKASLSALSRYEAAMRRDANGYALRYRAQRIVFDCLSENADKLTSSETKMAPVGEIGFRIANASTSICLDWLENQFGSEKEDLKPQKPMPMRVIWSANGPKDDPSMYGRVTF